MSTKQYCVQTILELACAAQRVNGRYVKETEMLESTQSESNDETIRICVHPNKFLILASTGDLEYNGPNSPRRLVVTDEDHELVKNIRSYYKRLAFAVMADPDNSFQQKILTLLNSENMVRSDFGFLACLPSTYFRDKEKTDTKKHVRQCDDGFLGEPNDLLLDKDCEVITVKFSDKFSCWNILGIIDNKLASWFSKKRLEQGPCVIVSAKVKDHREHWLHKIDETRLNYVKAAQ